MKKPSTWRVVGVAAGVFVAFGALFWLLSIRSGPLDLIDRAGLICATLSAAATLDFFWAVGFAFIAHKQKWSYRACRFAGICLLMPGSLLFLNHARPLPMFNFLVLQSLPTSYICRKLAFPEISDEDAAAPDPLPTMFPK